MLNLFDEIQNKWHGVLNKGIDLLHDNACPYVSNHSQDLITSFGWKQLDRPPYSPNLASSDYHFLLHFKKYIGGQHHNDNYDLKTAVLQWLSYQTADFYEDRIKNLVVHYDKYLNIGGNYV